MVQTNECAVNKHESFMSMLNIFLKIKKIICLDKIINSDGPCVHAVKLKSQSIVCVFNKDLSANKIWQIKMIKYNFFFIYDVSIKTKKNVKIRA